MSNSSSVKVGGLTLSRGNTKMGKVLNISLPPPRSCDTSLPCFKKGCYAMRTAYNLYPDVRKAWNGNMDSWDSSAYDYRKAIVQGIQKVKPALFRWHVGGDIPGGPNEGSFYVEHIVIHIAKLFPDVRFWMTTKKYDVVKACATKIRKCPNLSVVLSMWPGVKCHSATRRAWPTAWMLDPKDPDPRIPKDAKACPGRCDTCAACWNLKPGEAVVFKKH